MSYIDLIQDEFEKLAKGPKTNADFIKAMGDKEVSNPSPGKKKTIKIKSLKSGDDRQKSLYKQLYKQWNTSGSITPVEKERKLKQNIESLKQKLKEQQKTLTTSEKVHTKDVSQLRKEIEKMRQKMEKPTEKVVGHPFTKKPVTDEIKTTEKIDKPAADEIKATEQQKDVQENQNKKLQQVGDKSNEQYQETLKTVTKNEKKLYRDASFLSNPVPPDPEKIKTMQLDQANLERAVKAMEIGDAKISDVVNSPNVVTYKIDLSNLSDIDKTKAMKKLLSSDTKSIFSHFIGKKENVIIDENRDTDTIDVHVPKGTELKDRDPVSFKELVTNDKFVSAANDVTKLPIAFGKNENNETIMFDFSKTPHLIVSGATKSGKSVFIESIANSIQMGKSPEDVKMILIDVAKRGTEFEQFKNSEYLDRPIATSAKEAEESLQSLNDEVNRRNDFLKNVSGKTGMSFRNIEDWNSFITKSPEKMNETEKKAYDTIPEDQRKKMHRIVTIVDEAKDLFNKEVNPNAAKLFGMVDHMLTVARSVGAHMVIASQSPAKQNIPGKIQANIGAKMTFRLQNKNDAENIGVPDATDLLMYGDGYFEDPFSGAKPTRLQTGFIDKSDAAKINEKTKGDQKFIEKAPKKVMPKYEPTTESTSDFKLKTEETRKRLDEQRKRIQEDIANLERKRIQQDQTESENRQKRETSDQKRRELAQQQGDIESKKDLTPETIEPSTETTTDVAEPETADDDLQRQIDELTVEKPVDEVKKQMQKPKEEKLEEKPVQERKKGLLDRIKKFIGK
jgi:DNA segregation ATPase FtsK/SpoIIIE-like protein